MLAAVIGFLPGMLLVIAAGRKRNLKFRQWLTAFTAVFVLAVLGSCGGGGGGGGGTTQSGPAVTPTGIAQIVITAQGPQSHSVTVLLKVDPKS